MIESTLMTFWSDFYTSFISPQKRIFIGYLISSLLIAILWLIIKKRHSVLSSLRFIFTKKVWWSSSAKADYQLFLINKVLMLVLSPALLSQIAIASSLFLWLHDIFPDRPLLLSTSPTWLISLLFTSVYFLLDDFARFYIHRLMHLMPFLWAFHKVHHSATTMTPITVFRTHPIEMIIFGLRSSLVQGVCIASFVFFLGDKTNLITIIGANLFVFFFNIVGSNLRHSHIAIAYWKPLEKMFISPAQHHIHHSIAKEHHDKNFGVALAVWDWAFGSLHHSESSTEISFGIIENHQQKAGQNHSLKQLYISPFVDAVDSIKLKSFTLHKRFPPRKTKQNSKIESPSQVLYND